MFRSLKGSANVKLKKRRINKENILVLEYFPDILENCTAKKYNGLLNRMNKYFH